MFGFLIKKTFFDMWDNLLAVLICNVAFLALLAGLFSLLLLVQNVALIVLIGLAIVFLLNWFFAAVSQVMGRIADFQKVEWKEYPKFFIEMLPFALLSTGLTLLLLSVAGSIVMWNFVIGNIGGLAASAVLFWITVVIVLSLQYLFPIITRLDRKPSKIVKKCFIIFFDNTLFSFGLFFTSLIIIALSAVLAFMAPGIATVLLLQQVALRTRLYKYDYLEENPEANRKKIPWKALLIEDNEKIGPRSLRSMIFPWKD